MPGNVRPIADERDGLLAFLAQQRDAVRFAAHGLGDEQARQCPTPSAFSVGGVLKHLAYIERNWMIGVVSQRPVEMPDYASLFCLGEQESLAEALELYAEVAAETEEIVAGIADLGQPVPVPQGVPWFPKDVKEWSVRWVLLHLIEETARHAGHADIIRETLDGGTAVALMAQAEGWTDELDRMMAEFQAQ